MDNNIHNKIRSGYYTTNLPWPNQGMVPEACREARAAYEKDQECLKAEFKKNALEYCGISGHPKAHHAFAMAWDRGHAYGLLEVLEELEEIAELLR